MLLRRVPRFHILIGAFSFVTRQLFGLSINLITAFIVALNGTGATVELVGLDDAKWWSSRRGPLRVRWRTEHLLPYKGGGKKSNERKSSGAIYRITFGRWLSRGFLTNLIFRNELDPQVPEITFYQTWFIFRKEYQPLSYPAHSSIVIVG